MNISLDSISMTSPNDALALLRTWLRTERQRVSWTQRELARRSGVPSWEMALVPCTGGTRSRASVLSRSRRSASLPKLYISTLLHGYQLPSTNYQLNTIPYTITHECIHWLTATKRDTLLPCANFTGTSEMDIA